MRKTIYLIAFLLFVDNAVAQTKEETEEWIIKQSEMNSPLLKYRIEGDEMVSEVSFGPGAATMGSMPVQKAISISKITRITYVHTDKYLSYSLMCDSPCAYLLDEPDEKRSKFLFEIYRKLDSSFPPRMNKALLHLVKLHGGKASIAKQEAPKEAF